ncbi:MAG: hypothetical protein II392_01335 [Mycoplasma sp.]|nr:hypothetical protein [Mycoplasma sp.]
MANYHKLSEMLEDELDKIATSGKLTTSSLEVGDKAAHFLKSIKTVEAMEEAEEGRSYDYEPYMRDMSGNMDMRYSRNSYARGRGSNAKRDSMGRYASRYDGRSMHGKSQEELMEEIEMLREKVEKMED